MLLRFCLHIGRVAEFSLHGVDSNVPVCCDQSHLTCFLHLRYKGLLYGKRLN